MRKLKINKHLLRFLIDRSIVLLFFLFIAIITLYKNMYTVSIASIIGFLIVTIVTVIDYREIDWKNIKDK